MPVDTRFKDHVASRSSSHQRAKIFRMVRSAQLGIDKDSMAWEDFSVVYPAKAAVPRRVFLMPVSPEIKSLGAKTDKIGKARIICLDRVSPELPSHFGRRTPEPFQRSVRSGATRNRSHFRSYALRHALDHYLTLQLTTI